ncbi:MAG: hypothetical protein K5798_11070 [Nitrosopumilus sp.]|uniref:trypsin-like serine peptidase n=1 Tax=Nitrosopumilus sp. TaxID=2024843 RepID=UPI00242EE55D|nr:hypothetical protein [Nitrosopumilus sp.]MCV0367786.1 hypothetical protein [Nitrosopumilus sp.]
MKKRIKGKSTIKIKKKSKSEKFADRPLLKNEIIKYVKPRRALRSIYDVSIDLDVLLTNRLPPNIKMKQLKKQTTLKNLKSFNAEMELQEIGKHVFPDDIKVKVVPHAKTIKEPSPLQPYLPDHLPLSPFPTHLAKKLYVKNGNYAIPVKKLPKDTARATTIFAPDQRYTFSDTAYPWSTVGRVTTSVGSGSGVMVGPRHLLTVSHVIRWNSNGTAGWVNFTPSYFDGSAPFGSASGIQVYFMKKVTGPNLSKDESKHDYVVVVLNSRIGDLTGWMGAKTYSDSWDGGAYWSHIGYPGDLVSGQRPSFQGSISLDGSFWDRSPHQRIYHKGDVFQGQSGGPFFGWWSGQVGPHAVSVQSGERSDENLASGGSELVDLVIRARNDYS